MKLSPIQWLDVKYTNRLTNNQQNIMRSLPKQEADYFNKELATVLKQQNPLQKVQELFNEMLEIGQIIIRDLCE